MELIVPIISIIITISVILFLIIIINKNNYQLLIVKIEESKKNIEFFLNKKEELLSNAINTLKEIDKKKYGKDEILSDFIKSKNIKQTSYEKDESLRSGLRELNELIEDDDDLLKNNDFKKIYNDIKENEINLNASKKYFNKIITEIEKFFKNFPQKFMKNILGYKKINKYNTKKDEKFEILKKKSK